MKTVTFRVKTLEGDNISFSVDNEINITQLKVIIFEKMKWPVDKQRLIYCGRVLPDTTILSDCELDGKVLHLVQYAPPSTRRRRRRHRHRRRRSSSSQNNGRRRRAAAAGAATPDSVTPSNVQTQTTTTSIPPEAEQTLRAPANPFAEGGCHLFLNALAIPSFMDDIEGVEASSPTSRLNLARRMLEELSIILMILEMEYNLQREPIPATSEGDDDVDTDSADDQHDDDDQDSTDGSSPEIDSEDDSNNDDDDQYGRPSRRLRRAGPRDLAEVMREVADVHTRLQPFLVMYTETLSPDYRPPTVDDGYRRQHLVEQVAEMMHYLSHLYHAVSDVGITVGRRHPLGPSAPGMNLPPVPNQTEMNVGNRGLPQQGQQAARGAARGAPRTAAPPGTATGQAPTNRNAAPPTMQNQPRAGAQRGQEAAPTAPTAPSAPAGTGISPAMAMALAGMPRTIREVTVFGAGTTGLEVPLLSGLAHGGGVEVVMEVNPISLSRRLRLSSPNDVLDHETNPWSGPIGNDVLQTIVQSALEQGLSLPASDLQNAAAAGMPMRPMERLPGQRQRQTPEQQRTARNNALAMGYPIFDMFLPCGSVHTRNYLRAGRDMVEEQARIQHRNRQWASVGRQENSQQLESMLTRLIGEIQAYTIVDLIDNDRVEESWLNIILILMSRVVSLSDFLRAVLGVANTLEPFRTPLREFVAGMILHPDQSNECDTTQLYLDAVDQLVEQHQDFFERMGTLVTLRPDINVGASIRRLLRAHLPDIFVAIMAPDEARPSAFSRRMTALGARLFAELCALVRYCCADGTGGLQTVYRTYMQELTTHMDMELQRFMIALAVSNLTMILPRINSLLMSILGFVVRNHQSQPPIAAQAAPHVAATPNTIQVPPANVAAPDEDMLPGIEEANDDELSEVEDAENDVLPEVDDAENDVLPEVDDAENDVLPEVDDAENDVLPEVDDAENDVLPEVDDAENDELPEVDDAENDVLPEIDEAPFELPKECTASSEVNTITAVVELPTVSTEKPASVEATDVATSTETIEPPVSTEMDEKPASSETVQNPASTESAEESNGMEEAGRALLASSGFDVKLLEGLPRSWAPIILADQERQRLEPKQPPFSVGYLSGSSRTRQQQEGNEPQTVQQLVQEAIQEASSFIGSPLDNFTAAQAFQDPGFRNACHKFIRTLVRRRVSTDEDFSAERYPRTYEVFVKSEKFEERTLKLLRKEMRKNKISRRFRGTTNRRVL